jgi:3-dehydroquinate synthase
VPGGEAIKNDPALIERLQRRLTELGIDRHAFVAAIGGGAVLDAIGFVAATTHRGVRHIRGPDHGARPERFRRRREERHQRLRNQELLGSFTPPFAVLNDFALLDGLSGATRSPAWRRR